MVPLRRTLFWCLLTVTLVFAVVTVAGYISLLSKQTNQHAQAIYEHHLGSILWVYGRILIGYWLAGLVLGVILHPLTPGRRAGPATLGVVLLTLLYTLTSGTHLLYGPVHFVVAWTRDRCPDFLGQLYRPVQIPLLFGGLLLISLVLWARRLRKRWSVLALAAMALVLVSSGALFPPAPSGNRRPNFVLLASDSLRADHLSVNGYGRETTPHIDRLASRGMNYASCLVPTASTHESWVSILSSSHPRSNGLRHMFPSRQLVEKVGRERTWFPELMREQGYSTAVVGGWCGTTFRLFDMGFEQVDVSNAQNAQALIAEVAFTNHLLAVSFLDNPLGRWLAPELDRVSLTRAAPNLTRRALRTLDKLAADERPFFLLVKYHGTHLPYSATYPYYQRFTDPDYRGRNRFRIDFQIDEMIKRGFDHDLTEQEQQHLIALYDGCVQEFDDQVGAVVEHLERRGLLDGTVVGVLSDHGDDLYEHGTTLGHGVTLFGGDQANHVPAIFAGPGVPSGVTEARLVRSFDLVPTWCAWLGLPGLASFEGLDLTTGARPDAALLETSYYLYRQPIPDLVLGERAKQFPNFDEATFIDPEFDDNFVLRDRYLDDLVATKCFAVRQGRYKLIHVPGEDSPIRRLFDLEADPECRQDLKDCEPEVFRSLLRLLPEEASSD